MERIRWLVAFTLLVSEVYPCLGQKGSAPSGFYSLPYHGDTFTGRVVDSDGTRTLTLLYEHKNKSETFVGMTETPCMAPKKSNPREAKELHLSAIPKGTLLTVFYNTVTKKENGTKKKEYVILAIRFDELDGKQLTNPNRRVIPCSKRWTWTPLSTF